jgi:hypothetical protein
MRRSTALPQTSVSSSPGPRSGEAIFYLKQLHSSSKPTRIRLVHTGRSVPRLIWMPGMKLLMSSREINCTKNQQTGLECGELMLPGSAQFFAKEYYLFAYIKLTILSSAFMTRCIPCGSLISTPQKVLPFDLACSTI